MGDPVTWIMGASLALGGWGAYESYSANKQAAQAASDQARINAEAAIDAASESLDAGLKEAQRHREKVASMLGQQQARYAASGVLLEGTPADVMVAQAEIGEEEARDIVRAAQLKWEHGMQSAAAIAAQGKYESKYMKQKGQATLITGGSQLAWTGATASWKHP